MPNQNESKLAELETLQKELTRLETIKNRRESSSGSGMKDTLMSAVKQGLPAPAQAAASIADMNPNTRRALMTTAGTEIGMLGGGPMAAGTGAAVGGTMADLADNPDVVIKGLDIAATHMVNPGEATRKIVGAARSVTGKQAGDFAKRRAEEFASGAITGGLAKAARGVDPTGPLTATMRNPELLTEGGRRGALKALGETKRAARLGENLKEASRMRKLLRTSVGQGRLADEAIAAVKEGPEYIKALSPTEMLAYREALGKVMDKGGTFADDYAQAKNVITAALKVKNPALLEKLGKARASLLATGEMESVSPWVRAINPKAGLATLPLARRAGGVALRGAAEALPAAVATPLPQWLGGTTVGKQIISALENQAKKRKKGDGKK